MNKILTIIPVLLLLYACGKNDALTYQQDPRIYFKKYNSVNDSIIYSFGVKANDRVKDTLYLQLRIMGSAADHDREIKILLSDTSSAKWGYHFDLGPQIMPADQYETKIPVYIYRKPGLKDSTVTADFIIGSSKDFQPGYEDKPAFSVKDRLHFKISVTDKLSKPLNWDGSLAPSFGTYSIVKLKFMIQVTGRTDWTVLIYPNELNALSQQLRLALSEYEAANGPMIDENGAVIEFP